MNEMTTILPWEVLSHRSTVKRLSWKTYNFKLYESISVNVAIKALHMYRSLQDNKPIAMHILKMHKYLSVNFWL